MKQLLRALWQSLKLTTVGLGLILGLFCALVTITALIQQFFDIAVIALFMCLILNYGAMSIIITMRDERKKEIEETTDWD